MFLVCRNIDIHRCLEILSWEKPRDRYTDSRQVGVKEVAQASCPFRVAFMSDRYDNVIQAALSFILFVNPKQRSEFIFLALEILAKQHRLGCEKAVSRIGGFHGQASEQVVHFFCHNLFSSDI